MKKTVVFVGDVNVDLNLSGLRQDPVPDREVLATGFETAIGSSAAIASVAYASLGGSAAFFGVAGDDDYGRFMKSSLAEAGIDVSRIRLDASLRTGVTVNLVRDQQRTQITFPGAIPQLEAEVSDLALAGAAHVHFAGVYLQPRLLPRLGGLIAELRLKGISVSVDPQWDESEQWLHSEAWLGADTVLVNADEARSLARKGSLGEALEELARRCRCVVIKDGSNGAVARQDGVEARVGGHGVALVDTIGAGDNFAAGFLYSRLELGGSFQESLAYANATAARSCTFAGGAGARSRHSDIVNFLKESR